MLQNLTYLNHSWISSRAYHNHEGFTTFTNHWMGKLHYFTNLNSSATDQGMIFPIKNHDFHWRLVSSRSFLPTIRCPKLWIRATKTHHRPGLSIDPTRLPRGSSCCEGLLARSACHAWDLASEAAALLHRLRSRAHPGLESIEPRREFTSGVVTPGVFVSSNMAQTGKWTIDYHWFS